MESEIESRSRTNKMWLLEKSGYSRQDAIAYLEFTGADHSSSIGGLIGDNFTLTNTTEEG